MTARTLLVAVGLMSVVPGFQGALAQDSPTEARAGHADLNELSLEVTALQMLHQFQFSFAQMDKIRQCAKETAERGRPRQEGQASAEFRDKLEEVHKALVRGSDEDLIEQLSDELDDLRYEEKPALEDEVKLTPEARRHAPELLRLLKAQQYAAYTGLLVDLVDPLDLLHESLSKIRDASRAEWRDKRNKVAAEVGRLVGGVDAAKEEKLSKAAKDLLTRARKMTKGEFENQRAELEKEAGQIIGTISPADVIRNEVEYSIAELLSNARLLPALAARLQL